MIRILVILLLCLISYQQSLAYTPPLGIPAPTWGIDKVMPGRPEVWTSQVDGYYFVDPTSASKVVYGGVDCTNDSNDYGYLGKPRCALPATMKKGSRIEIYGPFTSYGSTKWVNDDTNPPNGNEWSANSDGPAWVTMLNTDGTHYISGVLSPYAISYLYFDGIYIKDGIFHPGTWSSATGTIDHIMLRNSKLDLEGRLSDAIAFDGGSETYSISNVIVYNNTVTNVGDMTSTTDDDNGGIFIGNYVSYAWVLENTLSNISAFAIFVGGQAGIDAQYQHHLYVGKNTVTNANCYGLWSKRSTDTIFSENIISDINDFPYLNGRGVCMGGQYELNRVWYVNNKCNNTTYGMYIGGPVNAEVFQVFVVGNHYYDVGVQNLGPQYSVEYNAETSYAQYDMILYEGLYYIAKQATTGNLPTNETYWSVKYPHARPEGGIMYAGSGSVWIVNNSIYDASNGIYVNGANAYTENNIISNLNDSGGFYFYQEKTTEKTISIKNNNFYGSVSTKFKLDTTEYTDLADLIADTAYGDGSISTDPSFVSAPTNLRLNSGSGARGTGLAAADLSNVTIGETTYTDVYAAFLGLYGIDIKKDIAGTTRPQETTWDIGAYEYDPGAVYPAVSIGAGAGVSIGSGATMTLY
jgi:hypothetical protein